jgi:hypothetical protein
MMSINYKANEVHFDRALEDAQSYLGILKDDYAELQDWAKQETERADKAEEEADNLRSELKKNLERN